MRKIAIKRIKKNHSMSSGAKGLLQCQRFEIKLESGEKVKRGCNRLGLVAMDVGWRCFYCGNYIYRPNISIQALWFHFKIAREYWRAMSCDGKNFVNGIPVSGAPDSLPRRLWSDLCETRPPEWFPYFVCYEEDQFNRYLETYRNGQ